MTNMQAAVGVAQLTKINQFIEKKIQIADWYKERLKDLANHGVVTLRPLSWAKCMHWTYSILIDKLEITKDELIRLLEKKGIETKPFFYPMHILSPYRVYDNTLNLAESISSKGLNLPSSPIPRKNEIEYIVETCIKIMDGVNK